MNDGSEKIANSIQDVEVAPGAASVLELLEKLKDMDAQRIAKDDSALIRKGVLALLPVVAELEVRIARLESPAQGPGPGPA